MAQIRQCGAQDFEEILLLLRQLFPGRPCDPASRRTIFDRALTSDSKTYFCATEEQNVIGFGSLTVADTLWPEGHLGYVDELVVDHAHRNKGIGEQLLEHLMDSARKRGCCRIELVSAFYRKDAHRFYERHGFESRAYLFSMNL